MNKKQIIYKKMDLTKNHKIIEEFPNYMVTDDGQIFSIKRQIYMVLMWKGQKNGKRLQVGLYKNDKCYFKTVHRIVALAFVENPDPEVRTIIDHIDNNPENNCSYNLRWTTQKENMNNRKNSNQYKAQSMIEADQFLRHFNVTQV